MTNPVNRVVTTWDACLTLTEGSGKNMQRTCWHSPRGNVGLTAEAGGGQAWGWCFPAAPVGRNGRCRGPVLGRCLLLPKWFAFVVWLPVRWGPEGQ